MSQAGILPTTLVLPPNVPLTFTGNVGFGSAVANNFDIVGTGVISTSVVGDTLTISSSATGTVTSVSGTANRITSTGGNTPVIDISASYVGQSSITTLGTIATGIWNGTAIDVSHGGTGQTTLTNHGVLIGAGSSAITQLSSGSAGQVLQSGGAGSDPSYSTPTYPSASGSSGVLLKSDGTNNVYTTTATIDSTGRYTNTTQPIFFAYRSANANNATGDGTIYTIVFDTAPLNIGGSYNAGNGIFTAPITGRYLFTATVNLTGLLITHTEGIFSMYGSAYENRFSRYNMGLMATAGTFQQSGSFIIPMTVGDTMSVFAFVTNGTKVVNVVGAAAPASYTNFSGVLLT